MLSWKARVFRANESHRDEWIRSRAETLAPGSRVLDLGAGTCRHRPAFSHCFYEAQDFCSYAPSPATSDVQDWSYGEINYVCDATSIPVPNGTFDAVLCSEVLEHVPEPEAVVREIVRILKPGGICFLTAPLGSGLHMMPYHFYGGFTPEWYRRVLSANGMTRVTIEPNGGFFRLYGQESQRFARLADPRRLPSGLLFAVLWAPFWLLLWPLAAAALPVVCYLLDRFERSPEFTVGYFVSAAKPDAPPA